jgi:hypothetical protein
MRIDLHCHSSHSDGVLTAQQLLDKAIENKIKIFSITDHDTIDAYANLITKKNEIELISGVEFSTTWNKMGIHIVGLNFNLNSKILLNGIAYQKNARIQRAKEISKKLEKFGLYGAYKTLTIKASKQIGRPDFAQLLVDKGICKDCNQAFKKILGAGKVCDVKNHWLDMGTVIKLIKDSGGVAILAHPLKYKLTSTKLKNLIQTFKTCGGEGLEVLSGFQTKEQIKYITQCCQQFELLASVGSDFHAPNRWSRLGCDSTLIKGSNFVWNRF